MQKYFSLTLRLWKLLKDFHKEFYIQLASIVVQQAIGVLVVFISAKMLDALIGEQAQLIVYLIGGSLILGFIRNRIIAFYTDLRATKNLDRLIQQFLEEYSFKKIFSLNPSQYQEGHSAIKLQVINRGEKAIEDIISTIVLTILPVVTQILFSVIAIAFYSKTIALWCLCTIAIVVYWSNKFSNFHRPFIQKNMENWDTQRKVRTEAFQHLFLIKIIAAEYSYLKKYLKNRFSYTEYGILTSTLSLRHGYNRGVFMLVSRSISTAMIFFLAIKSYITVGAVYAIWSWINDAYNNIQMIIQSIRSIPIRFVELEKYLEIIDTQPLFNEGGKTKITSFNEITFSNVSFKYPVSVKNVFSNLNFIIPGGKVTAFVGESGGGKSTIVKLLTRSYDYTDGSIQIDNNELKGIDAHTLRRHIGYVEQHVELFDDTLKENILLGVQEKDRKSAEKRLEEVARHARIDQFYHRLGESKFETILGERGVKLSGGERQRVGIARAIIKDPEILIFDEATSSLDTENEAKVMEAINDVSKGKTTIIIAHRLSTVRNADKIIVMDKGTIVGEGTHNELMRSNTVYQNLVAHQIQ